MRCDAMQHSNEVLSDTKTCDTQGYARCPVAPHPLCASPPEARSAFHDVCHSEGLSATRCREAEEDASRNPRRPGRGPGFCPLSASRDSPTLDVALKPLFLPRQAAHESFACSTSPPSSYRPCPGKRDMNRVTPPLPQMRTRLDESHATAFSWRMPSMATRGMSR